LEGALLGDMDKNKNKHKSHPILPALEAAWARIKKPSRQTIRQLAMMRFRDYEPEQAWGTAAHFREHRRFGGTREDY
jgi:hypothetical protein